MACRTDPAEAVVNAFITALLQVYDPESECPALGGGTTDVRFFAGDGPALATFDAHTSSGKNCGVPFVWVRVARRYRTKNFPAPVLDEDPACGTRKVLAIEVGVARCAVVELQPTWAKYAAEAEVSLDDSWRIEGALCVAGGILRKAGHTVAVDTINPYGPEGGIIAWFANAYIDFDTN